MKSLIAIIIQIELDMKRYRERKPVVRHTTASIVSMKASENTVQVDVDSEEDTGESSMWEKTATNKRSKIASATQDIYAISASHSIALVPGLTKVVLAWTG